MSGCEAFAIVRLRLVVEKVLELHAVLILVLDDNADVGLGSGRTRVADVAVADQRVKVLVGGLVVGCVRLGCLPSAFLDALIRVELAARAAGLVVEAIAAWQLVGTIRWTILIVFASFTHTILKNYII